MCLTVNHTLGYRTSCVHVGHLLPPERRRLPTRPPVFAPPLSLNVCMSASLLLRPGGCLFVCASIKPTSQGHGGRGHLWASASVVFPPLLERVAEGALSDHRVSERDGTTGLVLASVCSDVVFNLLDLRGRDPETLIRPGGTLLDQQG